MDRYQRNKTVVNFFNLERFYFSNFELPKILKHVFELLNNPEITKKEFKEYLIGISENKTYGVFNFTEAYAIGMSHKRKEFDVTFLCVLRYLELTSIRYKITSLFRSK